MRGNTERTLISVVMLAAMLVCSGCIWLAAGAAGVAGTLYVKGEVQSTLDATPDKIVAATEKAFKDLGIIKISASGSKLDGLVVGRTAADKEVTVTVKSSTEKTSEISIRVGTFGDETLGRQILTKIRANL